MGDALGSESLQGRNTASGDTRLRVAEWIVPEGTLLGTERPFPHGFRRGLTWKTGTVTCFRAAHRSILLWK